MAQVWANNVIIAVQMVATPMTGMIPLIISTTNFVQVGMAGAILVKYGDIRVFFGLIIPYGILELSCIVLVTTVSLRLFWVTFIPGNLPRTQAFIKIGRGLLPVGMALTTLLAIAGIEEAFLAPSSLLPLVKVLVAVMAYALITTWVVVLGYRAKKLGLTGDIVVNQTGYTL